VTSHDLQELSPVKRALIEVRQLRARIEQLEREKTEPIAVVGIGCRFPGGGDLETFWNLLRTGGDAISEVPAERWNIDAFYDADPGAIGKMYTRHGGFLPGMDQFDPHFFGISPREAVSMDPQQRLLLEVAWEALEHAGQAPDALMNTQGGVFIGITAFDYALLHMKLADPACLDMYYGTGTTLSVAAGRLAYWLGLHGPCLAIDTACSSSLVAIHTACQSLRRRECSFALAGGVNLILTPEPTINCSRAHMLSAKGRCRTFDADADGYVRAEGAGIIVLKRLSDAQADHDRVLAVIRGSAVNQDGRSSGLTVPHGPSQQALIREALENASVSADSIDYVEAHGTGTPLGDPIELQALDAVLAGNRQPDRPLLIGSVKTNIGHVEAAAGVAGLIKVVLSLQNAEIPPHLHFKTLNPHASVNQSAISIPTRSVPWPAGDRPRIAGVSGFGFSGTNAHVIVEEAPLPPPTGEAAEDRPLHVLALSAKSDRALDELAARYVDRLRRGDLAFADVCHTANTGRSHFAHRMSVVARSSDEARAALMQAAVSADVPGVKRHSAQSALGDVAFLFTGLGMQYVGMGRRLYETEPTFRETLDLCAAAARPYLDRPLLSVLYPGDGDEGLIARETYSQPCLFAVEYALAALWRSWGIEPAAVLGHSLGEDVAACVAGVFNLEDGLRMIAARGRLMEALPNDGEMAAVFTDESGVRSVIAAHRDAVVVAAVNGPSNIVISGERASVLTCLESFDAAGIRSKRLPTSRAFHSRLMDPILDDIDRAASATTFADPRIPVISNISGRAALPGEISNSAYWSSHVRESVQFGNGIRALWDAGCRYFVEIGPCGSLLSMGRRVLERADTVWVQSLCRERDDWEQILPGVASLYVHGCRIDWNAFDRGRRRSTVTLPTYPFQRDHYWLELDPIDGKPAGVRGTGHSSSDTDASAAAAVFVAELRDALPDERLERLEELLRAALVKVLRVDRSLVANRRQRLMDLGIDSLLAVELRNSVGAGLGLGQRLPATMVFDYPTIEAMAAYLVSQIFRERAVAQDTPEAPPDSLDMFDEPILSAEDLEQYSEEEVEAMLTKRLDRL
jgi:acyl transferase domain-containing protein